MSVVVQEVVGELELVEADDLLHPLSAFSWGIRVDVDPTRHVGVRLARHHPGGRVEGVAVALVVHRHEVHHDHVVRQGVQPEQAYLERGEHATAHRQWKHVKLETAHRQWKHVSLHTDSRNT